jgi:hypothetical protein
VVTWSDGDREEVLLRPQVHTGAPESSEQRFRNGLDAYREMLGSGGIVAFGANYFVEASGDLGSRLRVELQRSLDPGRTPEASIADLEGFSGSRAFASDFVRVNR